MEETLMQKTLAVLATVGALAATTVAAPAPAEARGIGPGLAFGHGPRYYGPGYYGGPYAYYGGPYAYYGGPYYRHRYYRSW
jgi:hypothetical protein